MLRINDKKVYNKKGKVRPLPYIFERLKALDGVPVHDALGRRFANAASKMRPYNKADLDYDVGDREYLKIDFVPIGPEGDKSGRSGTSGNGQRTSGNDQRTSGNANTSSERRRVRF